MTIEQAYEAMGADIQKVLTRLPNEALIARLAGKFLDDPTYQSLADALAAGDVETAFRAAHTLKGVCQNLGFENMYQPVFDITEILRAGSLEGTDALMEQITAQYGKTTEAIRAFQG